MANSLQVKWIREGKQPWEQFGFTLAALGDLIAVGTPQGRRAGYTATGQPSGLIELLNLTDGMCITEIYGEPGDWLGQDVRLVECTGDNSPEIITASPIVTNQWGVLIRGGNWTEAPYRVASNTRTIARWMLPEKYRGRLVPDPYVAWGQVNGRPYTIAGNPQARWRYGRVSLHWGIYSTGADAAALSPAFWTSEVQDEELHGWGVAAIDNVFAIGSPWASRGGKWQQGEVDVYRIGPNEQIQYIGSLRGNRAYDHVGHSVALSYDRENVLWIIVGAPTTDSRIGDDTGTVYGCIL